jgi:hypothetical protein
MRQLKLLQQSLRKLWLKLQQLNKLLRQQLKKVQISRNAAVVVVAAVRLRQRLKIQQRLQSLISKHNYSKTALMQAQLRPQEMPRNQNVAVAVAVRAKPILKRKRQIQHHRKRLKRNKSGSVELTQLGWFNY